MVTTNRLQKPSKKYFKKAIDQPNKKILQGTFSDGCHIYMESVYN
jgi:hypothetical protein